MRRQKIIRQLATAAAVVLIGTAPIPVLLNSITVICGATQPPIQEPLAPPDNFFDSNGVRIRYVDQGHGPPVILIHGYTGNIERHWIATGVFANLVKDHRVQRTCPHFFLVQQLFFFLRRSLFQWFLV